MDRWRGNVAIVTGAGSGIGAAIAAQLVKSGVKVVGFDVNLENVKKQAYGLREKSGQFYAMQVDMTNEEEILKAFKWTEENVGPVHILVNNAGITRNTSIIDGDSGIWKSVLDTNLLGVAIATREAVRDMRANNVDGHIICINSMLGHRVGSFTTNLNMYPPSKYAITALAEVLHNELNECLTQIKVTRVSPGLVNTNIFYSKGAACEEMVMAVKSMVSLYPEDVAGAVMYALSTAPHVQVHELTITHVNDTL